MVNVSAKAAAVDRRLHAAGVQTETAIAFMGCLIVVAADAQGLSLIPLISNLEKTYALTPTQASWTLSAPAVVGAGCVPTLARLGDRFGMRPLILASLLIGVVANLLCAVAPSFTLLVTARAILGMSAALPLIYAVLRARGTSERRTTRGVALITLAAGVGVALAYLLSGFIVQANGSVRTVFWALTALSALTVLTAWWILPDAGIRSKDPIDWGGAAGVSIGLIGVVLAVTEGNAWGWSSAPVLTALVGGAAILVLWVLYEARQRHPLVDVRRVSNRIAMPSFIVVAVCSTLAGFTNLAQATYTEMPTVTGYGLGLTVLHSAYALCVISVGEIIGGAVAGPVISRFAPRPIMAVGSVIMAANFVVLAYAHSGIWHFIVWDAIWGLAFAFVYSAANAAYLQDATPPEAAMYVSANTIVMTGAAGIGPALFTAILTSRTIPHTPIPDPVVFKQMWIYAAAASAAIAVIALLVRRPRYVPSAVPAGARQTTVGDIEPAPLAPPPPDPTCAPAQRDVKEPGG
jgi:MFS family permease